jgi:hypothetical protein
MRNNGRIKQTSNPRIQSIEIMMIAIKMTDRISETRLIIPLVTASDSVFTSFVTMERRKPRWLASKNDIGYLMNL